MSVTVRLALPDDAAAIVEGVGRLLGELRGTGPVDLGYGALNAARELMGQEVSAAVLVAERDGEDSLVGIIAATLHPVMHAEGRVAVIDDLWVAPHARSAGAGAALVAALFDVVRARGCSTVEVGLPRPSFDGLGRTAAFYRRLGFGEVGPRMRRSLA